MKRRIVAIIGAAVLASAVSTFGAFAQETEDVDALKRQILELKLDAMRSELDALKSGQAAMQSDLSAIKKLLEDGAAAPAAQARTRNQPPPFESAEISIEGAPSKGPADALVTLIEFTDYQCPFCARHFNAVYPELIKEYVDAGKLRYVVRDFPLTSIHPQAAKAAEAALCAGEQDGYWAMHDVLFKNQRALNENDLMSYAETLKLDMDSFTACLDSGEHQEYLQSGLSEGAKLGVRGTPSFFIGTSSADDPNLVTATKYLRGARGYDSFKAAIDELITAAEGASDDQPTEGGG